MKNRIKKLLPVLFAGAMLISGCADNRPVESETEALIITNFYTITYHILAFCVVLFVSCFLYHLY